MKFSVKTNQDPLKIMEPFKMQIFRKCYASKFETQNKILFTLFNKSNEME